MRDQQDQLGFHEAERVWSGSDHGTDGGGDSGRRPLVDDVEAPIAGVEGGSDEEGDQGGGRKHDEEREEPPLLRRDPADGGGGVLLRHLRGRNLARTSFIGILGFRSATEIGEFRTFLDLLLWG